MKKFLLPLLVLTCLFASCKRTFKDEVLAPELKAASSSFALLDTLKANYFDGYKISKKESIAFQYVEEIKDTLRKLDGSFDLDEKGKLQIVIKSINYFNRSTFYKARFNEEVSWNLTFTKIVSAGLGDQFSKTISGTSSFLDSSNTSWNGTANGNIFAQGDSILVELTFVGSDLVVRDKIYVAKGQYYKSNIASLLLDFEDGLINAYEYIDDKDPSPSPMPAIDKVLAAPQGTKSFRIYGTDYNGDYFCGGMNIQKLDVETMKNYQPSDIYLNMYIYGYPTDNDLKINKKATKLNIGFSEDENDSGAFEPLIEDTFEKQIAVDWVGWKLISVRYSELVRSGSKVAGGSGNGKLEPGKAFSANCNLISSPNGNIVGANIDYVIITYGTPFEANN